MRLHPVFTWRCSEDRKWNRTRHSCLRVSHFTSRPSLAQAYIHSKLSSVNYIFLLIYRIKMHILLKYSVWCVQQIIICDFPLLNLNVFNFV